jgi:hypothetical protein
MFAFSSLSVFRGGILSKMKCIFELVRLSIPFAFSFSRRYRAALSNNALRHGVRGPQAVILLRGCLWVLCQSSWKQDTHFPVLAC